MIQCVRPSSLKSFRSWPNSRSGQKFQWGKGEGINKLYHSLSTLRGAYSAAFSGSGVLKSHVHAASETENANPDGSNDNIAYWQNIPRWRTVSQDDFLKYSWQTKNTIDRKANLLDFLAQVLPEEISQPLDVESSLSCIKSREDFIADVEEGIAIAPMAIRLTPHILSVINWSNPLGDRIRRQYIPLKSSILPDHPKLALDSLHEAQHSPVRGLVHRYPDKVLFLATSVCPVYCRFCTRSYAVGSNTESVSKSFMKPGASRWNAMLEYIEQTPAVQDVVVSGGDAYYLHENHLRYIGQRLLSMANVKRIRFATKGLAVCPSRFLDPSDNWASTLVDLSRQGRSNGKQVAIHTHFNHPNEITWVTALAAKFLFKHGVIVRNQSVLLRGVNDDLETMSRLIRRLADLNIEPYYVYQTDMVRGVEDLRTPLSTILGLEKHLRGTIAGFMTPSFIVDLPGGGGKRLANSFESYDRRTGISTWKAPGVAGDRIFTYHDPLHSLE